MNTNVVQMVAMSPRGDAVQFKIEVNGKTLSCSITRAALEDHFWLEKRANEARLLGRFWDGQKRIAAIAERKARRSAAERIELTSQDFVR